MSGREPGDVAVCVVVKDRRELMMACLDAVIGLHPAPREIVVVDNGSSDGTDAAVAQRALADPRIRLVREPGSLGRARNAAVAAASCPVVAFTDSDCAPRPDWLAAGLAALGDPGVAVVQGRTVPAVAPTVPWSATQDISRFSGLYEACNVFYRREALLAAGGFDEAVGFFGEDTAAGWAVLRAGGRARWAPDAVVEHVVTTPGLAWHLRRTRSYSHWPALIRRFPEQRSMLWHRYFLRRRSAETDAAMVGMLAAVALRRPSLAAAAVPFLWRYRPRGRSRRAVREAAGAAMFDVSISLALASGSIRHRTVVL